MACYFRENNDTEISIPRYIDSSSGVTYYDIQVRVHRTEWLVERRYKDFAQLHDKLVEEISISKNMLPPKKIVGNKHPAFLEQRREQLERYLRELMMYFRIQLPKVLAEFLDFHKYDIIYLLQDLAKLFNENGDVLLSGKKEYNFAALEVYAISERLALPCPPESMEQRGKYDFSHVLDFCSQLEILIVTPVKLLNSDPKKMKKEKPCRKIKTLCLLNDDDTVMEAIEGLDQVQPSLDDGPFANDYNAVDVPIGRSNIIPKNLKFNLNAFRNLKTLRFFGLSTENIIDIGLLKPTLKKISVHSTTITHINQVLLCDNLHKEIEGTSIKNLTSYEHSAAQSSGQSSAVKSRLFDLPDWEKITALDFSGNLLTQIDPSVRIAPRLRELYLDQNRIKAIQHLSHLPHLEILSLSANLISECLDWHLELGNLVSLNISQNCLKRIPGLRKLLSLVHLDVSCNFIDDIEEVDHVACLPILENLILTGNPLSGSVDYRSRVLARFHERASEICLDNEFGSQSELDTALVLSALHKSKLKTKTENS